jgi:hypothetical protein
MISDTISARICPDVGSEKQVPISVYPDIGPDIGPDFEHPIYIRKYRISGISRYRVIPDIESHKKMSRYRDQYQDIRITGHISRYGNKLRIKMMIMLNSHSNSRPSDAPSVRPQGRTCCRSSCPAGPGPACPAAAGPAYPACPCRSCPAGGPSCKGKGCKTESVMI